MELPSKLLDSAVNEFSRLPGVGRKTALRYALHLLKNEKHTSHSLAQSILNMRTQIKFCAQCYNISDTDVCEICLNLSRVQTTICVVQDVRDVMAIENTGMYRGVYHVLGGLISPIEGIGPSDLFIDVLLKRVQENKVSEIIFALSATTEGDTTAFYLSKKLQSFSITISTLARGVSVGDELEYADEITLGRSLQNRIPYKGH
ncbi:MAG: recombination protein RecR [Bacteroidetes bacterium]|nr:recombination protein RecR [Bacteroidota bacterium]